MDSQHHYTPFKDWYGSNTNREETRRLSPPNMTLVFNRPIPSPIYRHYEDNGITSRISALANIMGAIIRNSEYYEQSDSVSNEYNENIVITSDYKIWESETSDLCAICREDISRGHKYYELENCHHNFHKDCIEESVKYVQSCPCCRAEINEIEEESE